MGAIVAMAAPSPPSAAPLLHLAAMIGVGIIVYAALLAVAARPVLDLITGQIAQIGAPLKRRFAR
jgi:hypothetical protein